MKIQIQILALLLTCVSLTAANTIKTPHGGRLIANVTPSAELLVTAAKK